MNRPLAGLLLLVGAAIGCTTEGFDDRPVGPERLDTLYVFGSPLIDLTVAGVPRDAMMLGEDTLVVLTRHGNLLFHPLGADSGSTETPQIEVGGIGLGPAASFVRDLSGEERVVTWHPETSTTRTMLSDGAALVDTVLPTREGLAVGVFGGEPSPRSHGFLKRSSGRTVAEVRNVEGQLRSLGTSAYLLEARGFKIDTLISFETAAYSRQRGELVACCGRAPVFARQAHWELLANGTVMFVPAAAPVALFFPSEGSVSLVPLPLATHSIRDEHMVSHALAHFDHINGPDLEGKRIYARRIRRTMALLRQEYSEEGPISSQVLRGPNGRGWVRKFDPQMWPWGLSDEWLIVDAGGVQGLGVSDPWHLVFAVDDGHAIVGRLRDGGEVGIAVVEVKARNP